MTITYYDDLVTQRTPNPQAVMKAAQGWLRTLAMPEREFTKGGAYRNRLGELVTWDATADGSYVQVQTWPGE